jgi:hypothetical protein
LFADWTSSRQILRRKANGRELRETIYLESSPGSTWKIGFQGEASIAEKRVERPDGV